MPSRGLFHSLFAIVAEFGRHVRSGRLRGSGQSADNRPPSSEPPPSVPNPPADASLSSLDLSVGEFDQPFQSSRMAHTASVGYLANTAQFELRPRTRQR